MSIELLPWAIGGVATCGAMVAGYLLRKLGRLETDVQALKVDGIKVNAELELSILEKLQVISIKLTQIDTRLINIEQQRHTHANHGDS